METATMEQTRHHFWRSSDIIGSGSTADVYRACRSCDGEMVAAKVFHPINKTSWNGEQLESSFKELATMQRLNHVNVIRLLGVDILRSNRSTHVRRVLIMEYCSKGSLQSMLEKPENYYGLGQADFTDLFSDLANGMQYLRSQNVIHRDIKPSNIMVQPGDDGGYDWRFKRMSTPFRLSNVYKLADFGAAKQLFYDYEEGFQSLVGTAEYLPPAMFEYWLSREHAPLFKAEGELWTVGVTLYQAASGQIPFKPYMGVRKDYHTMFVFPSTGCCTRTRLKIITEKPMGCLSGIQQAENGPIDYSDKLPITCEYSTALRRVLEPLLGRLLDAHLTGSYSLEAYFSEAVAISQLVFVKIFDSNNFMDDEVLLTSKSSIARLLDEVSTVFKVHRDDCIVLCDGKLINRNIDPASSIRALIKTSVQPPLFLCSMASSKCSLLRPEPFEIQKIRRNNNVRDAFIWAKEVTGNMHHLLKCVRQLNGVPLRLNTAALALRNNLQTDVLATEHRLKSFRTSMIEIGTNLTASTNVLSKSNVEEIVLVNDLAAIKSKYDQLFEVKFRLEKCLSFIETLNDGLPWIRQDDSAIEYANGPLSMMFYGLFSKTVPLVEFSEFLLSQFETETKQQHFNAENTSAHMGRRGKLGLLRSKMLHTLQGEVFPAVSELQKLWTSWISDYVEPLVREHSLLMGLMSSVFPHPADLVDALKKQSEALLKRCLDAVCRGEEEVGSADLDLSITQVLHSLAELRNRQTEVDDSMIRNDSLIKQIYSLLGETCDGLDSIMN